MYFDGGSRGNPGNGGGGAVIYKNNIEYLSVAKNQGFCTNNFAEYNGLVCGIKLASDAGIANITVYGDSLLVINQVNGIWKCKALTLKPILIDIVKTIKLFNRITLHHVPRKQNKRADELANQAMDNPHK